MSLNTQILIAAVLGVLFGFLLTLFPQSTFLMSACTGLELPAAFYWPAENDFDSPDFTSIVVGVSNLQAGDS